MNQLQERNRFHMKNKFLYRNKFLLKLIPFLKGMKKCPKWPRNWNHNYFGNGIDTRVALTQIWVRTERVQANQLPSSDVW